MAELTCGAARALASDLLDGLLTAAEAGSVKAHVASCPACPNLCRSMVAVHERLAGMAGSGLPPGFSARIRLILEEG